jgi:hypothetical protein
LLCFALLALYSTTGHHTMVSYVITGTTSTLPLGLGPMSSHKSLYVPKALSMILSSC